MYIKGKGFFYKKKTRWHKKRYGKNSAYSTTKWKYKTKEKKKEWYDKHDAFGKPLGYRKSDIMKFR